MGSGFVRRAMGKIQRRLCSETGRIVKRLVVQRRFVHVVDEPGHAALDKRPVLIAPPVADILASKVRKCAKSGPDVTEKQRRVLSAAGSEKAVPLQAVVENRIIPALIL